MATDCRLYDWYLGRHSFVHLQRGNNPELLAKYPRLPAGLSPDVYEAQIEKIKREKVE